MKTNRNKKKLRQLAATTAVCLGCLVQNAAADSPVGNWDFYFSGDQRGVAQINFYDDFTVDGIEISSPGKLATVPSDNPRSGSEDPDDPRNPGDANQAYEYVIGSSIISGSWGYDPKGRIIGSLILTSANATNGWSFKGVAKGTKMTATTYHNTTIGLRSVLRGVARGAPLPSIAGSAGFAESGKMVNRVNRTSQGYSRILNFTDGIAPNMFDVNLAGPGYTGSGFAILTRNNHIGIYTEHFQPGTTNLQIVVVSGPYNPTKNTAKLRGFDGTRNTIYSKLWSFEPLDDDD